MDLETPKILALRLTSHEFLNKGLSSLDFKFIISEMKNYLARVL